MINIASFCLLRHVKMSLQSFNSLFDSRHMSSFLTFILLVIRVLNSSLAGSRQESAFVHHQKKQDLFWS